MDQHAEFVGSINTEDDVMGGPVLPGVPEPPPTPKPPPPPRQKQRQQARPDPTGPPAGSATRAVFFIRRVAEVSV